MYLYVVIKEESECKLDVVLKDKENIELATGKKVKIIPYKKFTMNVINEVSPKAIIFSGFAPDLDTFDKNDFLVIDKVLKEVNIPILCICDSHQLLTELYNKDIYEVDKLYNYLIKPKSKCDNNRYKTNGFYTINNLKNDSIFENLPNKCKMKCLHSCEVKVIPKEFILIASSYHSKVESIRHKSKCIYSTQFHPEKYDNEHLDGKIFLRNFAKIVDNYWKEKLLLT